MDNRSKRVQLLEALAVTAELTGSDFSEGAARVMASDLDAYPLPRNLVSGTGRWRKCLTCNRLHSNAYKARNREKVAKYDADRRAKLALAAAADAERLREDAERYRFLRDRCELSVRDVFGPLCDELNDGMDAAIDAARRAFAGEGE